MAAPTREPVSLLLVTSSYLPVVGGSEIEAQRVCAALRQRGHSVRILCPGGPPMPAVSRWIDPCGIPVRIFGNRWPVRLRGYAFALGVVWTLLVSAAHYRLVYFLMPGLQVTLGVAAAAALGKRIVMKFSGANEIRKLSGSRTGRLQQSVVRRWVHRIMLLSPSLFEEAREAGFPENRLLWMPNPVDSSEFAPADEGRRSRARRELALPDEAKVVVFVGRLAPEKQLPTLVAAFARVLPLHPDAVLLLVGDGPLRQSLEDQVRQLGIQASVHFAGSVSPSAIAGLLQTSDVFALVSSLEGLPVSLLEAMSTGLAAVVSDIPANTQLVESGVNGLVVPLSDEASLALAIGGLLEDPQLRARLGAAARASVATKYSIDKIADHYEALFTELDV